MELFKVGGPCPDTNYLFMGKHFLDFLLSIELPLTYHM